MVNTGGGCDFCILFERKRRKRAAESVSCRTRRFVTGRYVARRSPETTTGRREWVNSAGFFLSVLFIYNTLVRFVTRRYVIEEADKL